MGDLEFMNFYEGKGMIEVKLSLGDFIEVDFCFDVKDGWN